MPSRVTVGPALVLTLIVAVTGCSSGKGQIHASATFDDVADMANGAPVQMSDVRIGQVTGIRLDPSGRAARVTLSFRRDADVPAAVEARVRRTTPLGEKFIELRPLTDDPRAPRLRDGATITRTKVVSDVEDLIGSGTNLFASLSAQQIAVLIHEGAVGFGGKGPQLREVLADLTTITAGYKTRTKTIEQLVGDLDRLSGALAPASADHARALVELARSTQILDETSTQFFATVRSLNTLAIEGRDLIKRYIGQMSDQIAALRSVTNAVASQQAALARLLVKTPGHNRALQLGVNSDNFAQVLNDFVVCGLPGGGEDPKDPLNSCTYVPQGRR
ncbi:MAG: MCE family protein [Actinobacteria bacterium]|nr:MCE family protein [Actinomycetota bacterium]